MAKKVIVEGVEKKPRINSKAKGGTLYLYGHSYICDNCKSIAKRAGIKKTLIMGNIT